MPGRMSEYDSAAKLQLGDVTTKISQCSMVLFITSILV